MGQHPYRGANSSSDSQDIPRDLQSTKIHDHMPNILLLLHSLNQINQDHTLPSCLFEVHCIITVYVLQDIWHCIKYKVTPM